MRDHRDDRNKKMLDRALGRLHTHLDLCLGLAYEVRSHPVRLAVSMVRRVATQVERVVLRVKHERATRHQVRSPHNDSSAQQQSFRICGLPGSS
jgi:hypothetical protein